MERREYANGFSVLGNPSGEISIDFWHNMAEYDQKTGKEGETEAIKVGGITMTSRNALELMESLGKVLQETMPELAATEE